MSITPARLIVSILNVLLEGAPERINLYSLVDDLESIPGVTLIHDIHIWTITSGQEAFTAHVLVDPALDGSAVNSLTSRMQDLLHEKYEVGHVTIQVEQSLEGCTENHLVAHLLAQVG